ncbi:hypothetical protein [uncultured Bacteroides sp.]|uniref:hypothetical protein n=1 Tax=uncultured Bacteroides sp. TaxID=162156 RepID=UPI00280B3E66|nr:hypothetical protein [uncultured Bacteroides sp.]
MRQFAKIYSLCLILLILCGVSACNDDLGVGTGTVKEGVPTTISLNFSTNSQTVQSRVEQPGETEYNVSSVYLFAFNSNGDKTGGQAFNSQNGLAGSYGNNSFIGTLSGFNVLSGSNQTLYALVNYDNANFTLSKSLDEINRIEDLEDLTVKIADERITLNRYSFFMLGKEEGVTVSERGVVTADDGGEVKLQMERLDAKITFEINTDIKEAKSGTVKFIPKSFLVKQLPLSARVVEAEENSSDIIYKSMTEDMKVTNFDKVGETESSFNFYMFENSVAPPTKGADGGSGKWIDAAEWIDATTEPATYKAESMYALREKEVKKTLEGGEDMAHPGMTEQNTGNYVYAPEHATSVEITGELSYERSNKSGVTEYVNVSARYTIHLGETGTASNRNDEEYVNNYMVKRNTHYTYTITLTGINSYQAEVESDQEKRPGMEGDVIIAGDQVKAIDSHFARTRIKFTREALEEGLSWIVQTPFDKGMKLYDSDENSIKDYKWILFAVNKEFGLDKDGTNSPNNSNMVKFPGYDAYDGGASTLTPQTNASNDEGNGTADANGTKWINRMSSDAYYYQYKKDHLSDDACLRDVNQLINHLKAQALREDDNTDNTIFEFDENGKEVVYVTAFVDEYMYNYNPLEEEYKAPEVAIDNNHLLLWKKVVNGSERMMHICVKGAQYSPDGDTSWSNSVVTFRQTPIYSMYDASKVESAWGTESILETGPLAATTSHTPSYTLTMNNGRKNTLAFFVNQDGATNRTKWTDVLSRDAEDVEGGEHELNGNYLNTWYACMTRNRDLDGDNVIDPEEVRWCLASIDELTDLWIGENALPQTAKLYKGDGSYMEHMASSSGAEDTPWIIWAEEGASRGQYNDGSYNKSNYTYRCIRYLGISLDNVDATPTDYVQVTLATPEVSSYGESYRIDVSRLSNAAKRDLQDSGCELPKHYERGTDYLNMPYTAFEVLTQPQGQGNVSRYWNNDYENMINSGGVSKLCPEGYRIPNQRELLLMLTSLSSIEWKGSYWASTEFSYCNKGIFGFRPGFATSDGNLILVKPNGGGWDNVAGKVRCVRDVK